MNEMREDFEAFMQSCILKAITVTAAAIMVQTLQGVVSEARQRLKEVLGHEPTQADWDDLVGFVSQLSSGNLAINRDEDREEIRRLVMGG